ncbi:hypothetical protein MPTK1_5g22850 [Marchantia polymorpha subsp. ruderalis]|uniref:RING-type domain-containing protein n=2 Tax=Marchantia polymorpha TaxID=3197 RepID=A0A176VHH0_MARPO|nr:hypothetical protein AXG93_704s1010 [Marchantia polymorpha subsp. ruderalis]PTQ46799.1 hypothetical protein MARPO_0010s0171 [Marchantia polymorpha]BBN12780.1 hypothetical protein Mp_5g22850 [Marchantia polymorpha subsp. ruderalis]|eukprot:PTQ46799.1 hypothetical protein MARPO_0010s0171 [Marchantia polymorpha]
MTSQRRPRCKAPIGGEKHSEKISQSRAIMVCEDILSMLEDEAQGVESNRPRVADDASVLADLEPTSTSTGVASECRMILDSLENLSVLRMREERTCSYIKQLNGVSRDLQLQEQELIARLNQINEDRTKLHIKLNLLECALCSMRSAREEKERVLNDHCTRAMELHEEKVSLLELSVEGHRERVRSLESVVHELKTTADRNQEYESALLRLETEKEKQESERARFRTELDMAAQALEKEVDKHICQICMNRSRNALVMPCMHFLFCSDCLHAHQGRSNECPTCRGSISAIIHCKLNVER